MTSRRRMAERLEVGDTGCSAAYSMKSSKQFGRLFSNKEDGNWICQFRDAHRNS